MRYYIFMQRTPYNHKSGSIMLLALVFGAIFFTVFSGLSGYVLSENNFEIANRAKSNALSIAEAGVEYYRWHLAHFPNDLQNGTGLPGPYTIDYNDPEGGVIGTYTLDISGTQSCGKTTSIDIKSTGVPEAYPNISRTIVAHYAQPTVAQYSYVINGSVWAGPDRIINGPYHSNGGIRMDGTANAPVTSSVSSWDCTRNFGCVPDQWVNGVFGSGDNQNLWKYPTPQIDFNAISANFSSLRSIAQTQGLYFPRYSTGSSRASHRGYLLDFNGNGTITVYKVTRTYTLDALPVDATSDFGWNDHTVIASDTLMGTYTIPADCALIFVEDNIWVEGVLSRKVTLVSANIDTAGIETDAVLKNSITYNSPSAGLTLMAQNDVLIGADSPEDMTLYGIFVAQNGAFGRNGYACTSFWDWETRTFVQGYLEYSQKNSLSMYGTVVSQKRTGTQWSGTPTCGNTFFSGYATRTNSFDRSQFINPPPFTPTTSSTYKFIDWRQE